MLFIALFVKIIWFRILWVLISLIRSYYERSNKAEKLLGKKSLASLSVRSIRTHFSTIFSHFDNNWAIFECGKRFICSKIYHSRPLKFQWKFGFCYFNIRPFRGFRNEPPYTTLLWNKMAYCWKLFKLLNTNAVGFLVGFSIQHCYWKYFQRWILEQILLKNI